ncbi:hypothetical protein QTP88_013419 [Uroleucon formosanum]
MPEDIFSGKNVTGGKVNDLTGLDHKKVIIVFHSCSSCCRDFGQCHIMCKKTFHDPTDETVSQLPPDILDYPTSTDMAVREGGNVSMQCAASGFPTPNITWRKEGGLSISLSPNTDVPPMIWIQNQLVGAQEGQSVTLECTSEAYPKSIDYWTKDKTTIISNGTKYHTDLKDNAYKTHMKLTIISVTLSDYGTYQCVSKNSLGETDGTIKLYAVPKPTTTTTTTTTTTAATTTTSTTTTNIVPTSVAGRWWTTEMPKKSSKFSGKAPANEVDRRPSKKTGKYQDAAEAANNEKDDPTDEDQQQSSRAAAAADQIPFMKSVSKLISINVEETYKNG